MKKARVMIVEDEAVVALDLQYILTKFGFEVTAITNNYTDALFFVGKTLPNLVIMDINIKGAVDGFETANEIKNIYQIGSLLLTARTDDVNMQRIKQTTCTYLIKPFLESELKEIISTLIN